MSRHFYTWDDLPGFVHKVASHIAYRYRRYVEYEDVSQELYAWLYSKGEAKVRRWLQPEAQQTVRIHYGLLEEALKYAESEKAQQLGYKPEDIWWYSQTTIESLMPMVLDPAFTQPNSHVGELLTMVLDIRRAVQIAGLTGFFREATAEHEDWKPNVQRVLDLLGGELPAIGRRRALTNAAAQSITTGSYE